MDLDPNAVASLTVPHQPAAYLRVTPFAHSATPLGMGFGKTRFASPADAFKLLYIAENLATGVAEAIIRDRFEGATERELTAGEVADWGVTEVSARLPLHLLDMRTDGCFLLGVSTDITGAKAQDEARNSANRCSTRPASMESSISPASRGKHALQCMTEQSE
jgi:hypothetical protein